MRGTIGYTAVVDGFSCKAVDVACSSDYLAVRRDLCISGAATRSVPPNRGTPKLTP